MAERFNEIILRGERELAGLDLLLRMEQWLVGGMAVGSIAALGSMGVALVLPAPVLGLIFFGSAVGMTPVVFGLMLLINAVCHKVLSHRAALVRRLIVYLGQFSRPGLGN